MSKYHSFYDTVDQIVTYGIDKEILHLFTGEQKISGTLLSIKGKPVVNFGSCSYLGLEFDPRLKAAATIAIEQYGTQFSASRAYISLGLYDKLQKLLEKIFKSYCVITPTTTLGHIACIPVIAGDEDLIILDQQVHNSVQTAVQLLKARGIAVELLRHSRMDLLEERIKELRVKYKKIWYMADGIYSMFGDSCPVEKIITLMDQYPEFHFYVDDAHGMSLHGKNGEGFILNDRLIHPKMVVATSLNKAFASGGGVLIFGDPELGRKVGTVGGPLLSSGPMQPSGLGAAIASAQIHLNGEIKNMQEDLKDNIQFTSLQLKKYGLPIISQPGGAIFFVGVSLPKLGHNLVKRMLQSGYYVNLGVFPTVPLKQTGIRFTITRLHSFKEIENMIATLAFHFPQAMKEEGITLAEIYKWWKINSTSSQKRIRNYYEQTLKAGYIIKDNLEKLNCKKVDYFKPILLFTNEITPESKIPQTDHKIIITSLGLLDRFPGLQSVNGTTLTEWRNFAFIHSLQQIGDPRAVISKDLYEKERIIKDYYSSFIFNYSKNLKYFIPTECYFDGQKINCSDIFKYASIDRNILFSGPSGCGKSITVKYLANQIIENDRIPIYLEAKYFDSFLNPLLNEEVKILGLSNAGILFKASENLSKGITIILDGFNECNHDKQKRLLKCFSALCFRYYASVIIISQNKDNLLEELNLLNIEILKPSFEIKQKIALQYCHLESLKILEPLLQAATSGMEAMIIGSMSEFSIKKKSKYALFDFFVRKKLKNNATEGIQLLSCTAIHLFKIISFSLSVRQFDSLMIQHHISTSIKEILINENLLNISFDKISFSHELFLQVFSASIVYSETFGVEEVMHTLNMSKNKSNRVFLLGAIENETTLLEVLPKITDSKVIVSLFAGEGGEFCRQWCLSNFTIIFEKLKCEASSVKFSIKGSQYSKITIDQDDLYNWSASEYAFIYAVADLLFKGHFIKDIMETTASVDKNLSKYLTELLPKAKEMKIAIRSDIFSSMYAPFSNKDCGFSRIMICLRSGLSSFMAERIPLFSTIKNYIDVKTFSEGKLYVALALLRFTDEVTLLFPILLECIQSKWKYLPYHLKIEILESVGRFYEKDIEKMQLIDALNKLPQDQNIFISNSIFEALQALGGLEEDEILHEATAIKELHEIFEHKDDPEKWQAAFTFFYCQFDHPYGKAYYNVISSLSVRDKKTFIILAVKGATDGLFVSSVILEFAKLADQHSCIYLEKWRTNPPSKFSHFPQDKFTVYFLVHVVVSHLQFPLNSMMANFDRIEDKALCACAEICYWINRKDLDISTRIKNCEILWNRLNNDTHDFSTEAIYQCLMAFRGNDIENNIPSTIIRIEEVFPEKIAVISRKAIECKDTQKVFSSWDKPSEAIKHAILMLEQYGCIVDIPIIRNLANKQEFGNYAVDAIKTLEIKFNQ